jgi:lysozyme family protein
MARSIPFTAELEREYDELFATCQVRPERVQQVDGLVTRLLASRARYRSVGSSVSIPWYFVGLVHCLECGFSFERHLHNGDPLTARTRQVPAGRPKTGSPPFTWEESAVDALADRRDDSVPWTIARILYRLEAYNGLGYRRYHPTVKSPYLWSFSNHYTRGKYVGDGRFDATAASKQCGAGVLLRRLYERGELDDAAAPAGAAVHPTAAPSGVITTPAASVPPPRDDRAPVIAFRQGGPPTAEARELQRFLNRIRGIAVVVDGIPGENTSEAFRVVTGRYLAGDPRERATA